MHCFVRPKKRVSSHVRMFAQHRLHFETATSASRVLKNTTAMISDVFYCQPPSDGERQRQLALMRTVLLIGLAWSSVGCIDRLFDMILEI
jgi:hypothetical protein